MEEGLAFSSPSNITHAMNKKAPDNLVANNITMKWSEN